MWGSRYTAALTWWPSVAATMAVTFFAAANNETFAETYRVGPAERFSKVSDIAPRLRPGDIVEVRGDIVDAFALSQNGTNDSRITIRGIPRIERGCRIRPRITFDRARKRGIVCTADWNTVEGLDISGAVGMRAMGGTAIHALCGGFTLRDCRIHHCSQGLYAKYQTARDVTIESCEFDSIGQGLMGPCIYLETPNPGATSTIQYCYFHDGVGGPLVISSYPRNVIRYNWFEGAFNAIIKIQSEDVAAGAEMKPSGPLRPMHSDIVANVFVQGWSPGSRYCVLQLGGAGAEVPGTEGDFNIAHNLFIVTSGSGDPAVDILVQGNVDHVNAFNNVFIRDGVRGCSVYLRDATWDTDETRAFVARRGSPDPIVGGSSNWISDGSTGIPGTFVNTLRGLNPKCVDFLNGDYSPRKDSPLAGTGMWPLPRGRIVDLVPKYEPQRGIPADLKPKLRRKVIPPSIGPFEVADR